MFHHRDKVVAKLAEVEDYIRSVPELMGKVEEVFIDWLEDLDYKTIAEEYLNNLERTLQYR